MRIQVLNPANAYKPIEPKAVRGFLEGNSVKDGVVLKINPTEGHDLKIINADSGALYFDDKAGLSRIQLSALTDFGLTHFAVNDERKVA